MLQLLREGSDGTGLGFESVANGVSEIENLTQAVLAFIGRNDVCFQTHRVGDDFLQQSGIAMREFRGDCSRKGGTVGGRR